MPFAWVLSVLDLVLLCNVEKKQFQNHSAELFQSADLSNTVACLSLNRELAILTATNGVFLKHVHVKL